MHQKTHIIDINNIDSLFTTANIGKNNLFKPLVDIYHSKEYVAQNPLNLSIIYVWDGSLSSKRLSQFTGLYNLFLESINCMTLQKMLTDNLKNMIEKEILRLAACKAETIYIDVLRIYINVLILFTEFILLEENDNA